MNKAGSVHLPCVLSTPWLQICMLTESLRRHPLAALFVLPCTHPELCMSCSCVQAAGGHHSAAVTGSGGGRGQHCGAWHAHPQPVHLLPHLAPDQAHRDCHRAYHLCFLAVPLRSCLLCAVPPGAVLILPPGPQAHLLIQVGIQKVAPCACMGIGHYPARWVPVNMKWNCDRR